MTELPRLEGITSAKDRLNRISRHFLSDEDAIFRIAVITDPDDPQTLQVDGLARALAGYGKAVAVIDIAGKLISLVRTDPGTLRPPGYREIEHDADRFLANMRCKDPPDIMIIAAPPPAAVQVATCAVAVLAVPIQPPGMRTAYLRLKTLMQLERTPRIGITLTGAGNRDEAESHFNKFARAAYNFLGIRVSSYSYLADHRNRGTGPRETASCMDAIARLLLDDWCGNGQYQYDQNKPQESMPKKIMTKGQP